MTANADRNVCIHNAKPFEDETDGKEHCGSQNEQQVLGRNQNGPWTYLHKYKM